MPTSRITHLGAQIGLTVDDPTVRITQLVAQVGMGGTGAHVRITQLAAQVGIKTTPRIRITQLAAQTGVPYAPPLVLPIAGSAQLFPQSGSIPGVSNPPSGAVGGIDVTGTYPNALEVVGLRQVPLVGGPLTAGQVWGKHPTLNQLVPLTPGGPASLYGIQDPFAPDTSPHALNQEFSTTDLSPFTKIYITGETGVTVDANTMVPGSLCMELPTQQYRWRAVALALPADTNFTIHSAIAIAGQHAGSLIFGGGIFLSDGVTAGAGSQTAVSFGNIDGATEKFRLVWAKFGNDATSALASPRALVGGGFCFLRLRRQAGTYYAGWGFWDGNGVVWDERSMTLLNSITPTHFGLYGQNYSGVSGLRLSFPYLRYYANGTQTNTGVARNVYA